MHAGSLQRNGMIADDWTHQRGCHINFRWVHHDENVSGVEAVTQVADEFVLESTLSRQHPKRHPTWTFLPAHSPVQSSPSADWLFALSLNCSKEKVFGHSLLQATGGRSTKAWTLRGSAVALGRHTWHHANTHGYLQTTHSIPLFTNRPTLPALQTTLYPPPFCLVQPTKPRANGLAAQVSGAFSTTFVLPEGPPTRRYCSQRICRAEFSPDSS